MSHIHRRGLFVLGAASLGAGSQASATPNVPLPRPPLTPQTVEGPYYLPSPPQRIDLSEDLAGVPLQVRFNVLDETGAPLTGARVDIWHCDAVGRYSGFGGSPGEVSAPAKAGARFLRGALTTDPGGTVEFRSIYPGWYAGRTTHIHFKVWWQDQAVLTCQFFLPDALSEFLYTQIAAYKRERLRDTLNRSDGIALMAGERAIGSVREADGRYLAALDVVVDRAARPVAEHGPGGPPPGGRFGRGPPPPGGAFPGPPPDEEATGRPPEGPPPSMHKTLQGTERIAALLPGAALPGASRSE